MGTWKQQNLYTRSTGNPLQPVNNQSPGASGNQSSSFADLFRLPDSFVSPVTFTREVNAIENLYICVALCHLKSSASGVHF